MALTSIKANMIALERLSNAFGPLLAKNLRAFFRFAPTLARYLLFLLLLVNVRSWPLAWHIRVFRPVFRIRFQYKLLQLRTLLRSRPKKIQAEDEWLDSICPIGADPLNYKVKYNSWASIDDCDFNGHLSNSSYAKTMDSARFKCALAMFPMFFRAGGWMALAATHYHFIREIPMLASYEVRLSVATWDHKWFYVIAKFVTKPSRKGKKPVEKAPEQPSPSESTSETTGTLFNASLRTPAADEISSSSTPLTEADADTYTDADTSRSADTARALKAVAASLASTSDPEPDGAILHTICVSQCCFKVGRITVPPALVLAVNGLSRPPQAADTPSPSPSPSPSSSPYSHVHPPPHWVRAKRVMSRPRGGSTKALRELLKGGWRNVPEGEERWWDVAMGGVTEERRRKGLEVMGALGMGIAGVRQL